MGNTSTTTQPQYLKVQPSSLSKASQMDQVKLSGMVGLETMKLVANHEKVMDLGNRLTPPALRGRVTPMQTLSVIGLLFGVIFLVVGYIIGFSKLMVASSLLALLLMISSPDWMRGIKENKPMKLVLKQSMLNLGMRWKEMLVHSTGYNVPDKLAAGSLVLMVIWTGKMLFTPVPSSRVQMMSGQGEAIIPTKPAYDYEFIYKLGYEDGKSGDTFGASLPADVIAANTDSTPLDWDSYNPPPLPRQSRSNLGMGTLLSMFALFRFGRELVTHPDGSLIRDPNLIIMKLKSMEPWRLGLIFMSVYRVVGALRPFIW